MSFVNAYEIWSMHLACWWPPWRLCCSTVGLRLFLVKALLSCMLFLWDRKLTAIIWCLSARPPPQFALSGIISCSHPSQSIPHKYKFSQVLRWQVHQGLAFGDNQNLYHLVYGQGSLTTLNLDINSSACARHNIGIILLHSQTGDTAGSYPSKISEWFWTLTATSSESDRAARGYMGVLAGLFRNPFRCVFWKKSLTWTLSRPSAVQKLPNSWRQKRL